MFIASLWSKFALQKIKLENNFTGEESQKTVGELYCSEQLKEGRLSDLIFFSVLNIFLSITAFLLNTLILVALHKGTSLNKPSKLLFRNLAQTDLCVGIIAQPLFVAYLMSGVTERWDICYYADFANLISSIILCAVRVFININCNKRGKTPRPVVGP